jgi:hypothetical protein
MLPDWLIKPEFLFAIALFFLSPFLGGIVTRFIFRPFEAWHAIRSESGAKERLTHLYFQTEHPTPPTVQDIVNRIICSLPMALTVGSIAVAIAVAIALIVYSKPHSESQLRILLVLLGLILGVATGGFLILSIEGVKGVRLLNHQPHAADDYAQDIRNQIKKIKKKFPQLQHFDRNEAYNYAKDHLLRGQKAGVGVEEIRVRLRSMSDEALRDFENAMRYMASPEANISNEPSLVYEIQLVEVLDEQRRRHPSEPRGTTETKQPEK